MFSQSLAWAKDSLRACRQAGSHQSARLYLGGAGAVIACNHVGWADSLWVAYIALKAANETIGAQIPVIGPSAMFTCSVPPFGKSPMKFRCKRVLDSQKNLDLRLAAPI